MADSRIDIMTVMVTQASEGDAMSAIAVAAMDAAVSFGRAAEALAHIAKAGNQAAEALERLAEAHESAVEAVAGPADEEGEPPPCLGASLARIAEALERVGDGIYGETVDVPTLASSMNRISDALFTADGKATLADGLHTCSGDSLADAVESVADADASIASSIDAAVEADYRLNQLDEDEIAQYDPRTDLGRGL